MTYIPRIREVRESYAKSLKRPQLVDAYLQLAEAYIELEAKYNQTLEGRLDYLQERLDNLP